MKLATECVNIKMDYLNESIVECYQSLMNLDNVIGRIERVQKRADANLVVVKPGKESSGKETMAEFAPPKHMEHAPRWREEGRGGGEGGVDGGGFSIQRN